MEEIRLTTCKSRDICHINWCRISSINSMSFPGSSAGDLFQIVKTWPFQGLLVTSNWGINRSHWITRLHQKRGGSFCVVNPRDFQRKTFSECFLRKGMGSVPPWSTLKIGMNKLKCITSVEPQGDWTRDSQGHGTPENGKLDPYYSGPYHHSHIFRDSKNGSGIRE